MENRLPIYHHPTLTVLIDDSQGFLDSLALQFDPRMVHIAFDKPREAIDWLKEAHQQTLLKNTELMHIGYEEDNNPLERCHASINVADVYRISMSRERFKLPAVMVIDYAMPDMNGLEFCQAIQHLPCKKILLTGKADEKIGVDAFNRKLIDCFINKNNSDASLKLENAISTLQKLYFQKQTDTLGYILSRHAYSFLSDPAISQLVAQVFSQHDFVEYYLFANPTGILFFDMQGKAKLMVIETIDGFGAHTEIAQDQFAPSELLSALHNMSLVPFFFDTDGVFRCDIHENWSSYCLPSQVLKGKQDYYWALFDLPRHYLNGSVYSYGEYLRDQKVFAS